MPADHVTLREPAGQAHHDESWWRTAVFYEVFVPSFADGNGDGMGDLHGVRARLPHLRDLGVDALWLTPFYPSPRVDAGYDVADYRGVDPRMGDLDTFDRLLADAHDLSLRVLVDIVPNHTSDRHPWFQEALASPPGSPARARYHFARGRDGADGPNTEPPNNWHSAMGGGPAWTPSGDGDWYLHLFTPSQPDLNWRNPQVHDYFDQVLRFWLDRGADGIRIDVAYGMYKHPELPDNPGPFDLHLFGVGPEVRYSYNQPEVLGVHHAWRRLLDGYEGGRAAVGEIWLRSDYDIADYAAALHQVFNFRLMRAGWSAAHIRGVIDDVLATMQSVRAAPSWVLGNHDVERVTERYGGGERGRRRAVAAGLMQLALPGAAYLYAGDELAMPHVPVPPDRRLDPVWPLSGHQQAGRDSSRIPLPWEGEAPPYGFTDAGVQTYLPQPEGWADLTVAAQRDADNSPLAVFREALRLRREHPGLRGGELAWHDAGHGRLAFARGGDGERQLDCVVNLSESPMPLPDGEVLLASVPLGDHHLPPDSAAWVEPARR